MKEQIKYIPVFGSQHLFKLPSTEIIVVGPHGDKTESNIDLMIGNTPDDYVIVAMRRIIKEPKRWTWEDKKAGRLPEVGSRVDFCHKLNTNWLTGEIKYIDDQVAVIKADAIDRPFVYEVDRVEFKPIETPEEKAARLREEWKNNVIEIHQGKRRKMSTSKFLLDDIYDALLSGELAVPKGGE